MVIGNPPWGRIKLQEKKWFAHRSPEIASAPNKAARAKLIKELKTQDPRLYQEFGAAKRHAERTSGLIRSSGRYPLSAKGDINTYQIFADLMRTAGRWAGMIVPSGIASDDQTKHFFNDLVHRRSLVSLFDFENRKALFRRHSCAPSSPLDCDRVGTDSSGAATVVLVRLRRGRTLDSVPERLLADPPLRLLLFSIPTRRQRRRSRTRRT